MDINVKDQVVLLLTVCFSSPGKGDPKPLTPSEWHIFCSWLDERGQSLDQFLLKNDTRQILEGWNNQRITADRIRSLLARAGALGLSLERWYRVGLWIMTCFDDDYPSRLKNRLPYRPPVFFGCGNRKLLNSGGIAVIGSRNVTEEDIKYTRSLGAEIVSQGYSVVSGGARGVDDAAMSGAMTQEGTVIGVLSDNLMRAATSSKYRKSLLAGDLALVSSVNPEAGFNVGNAMVRNKYVYCLSDAAIVIESTKDKGGTWSGAVENLSNRWVPLWVKSTNNKDSGNHRLVAKGGEWIPDDELSVAKLIVQKPVEKKSITTVYTQPLTYQSFLVQWEKTNVKVALKKDKLLEMFALGKKCLDQWLKQGVADGKISKYKKPVRYKLANKDQLPLDFWDGK